MKRVYQETAAKIQVLSEEMNTMLYPNKGKKNPLYHWKEKVMN